MTGRSELEVDLRAATGLERPIQMCNTGGPEVPLSAVPIVLRFLGSSDDLDGGSICLAVLRRSRHTFDGTLLREYFERHEGNRWYTGETIRRSKAKVPCEWIERALLNESFGKGREMLCEAIAKKCPKPHARRVLLAELEQLPGHAPTGLGTAGTPEDIPRLSDLAMGASHTWQRKECEKAIRKICRRHGLPNPKELPASKRRAKEE